MCLLWIQWPVDCQDTISVHIPHVCRLHNRHSDLCWTCIMKKANQCWKRYVQDNLPFTEQHWPCVVSARCFKKQLPWFWRMHQCCGLILLILYNLRKEQLEVFDLRLRGSIPVSTPVRVSTPCSHHKGCIPACLAVQWSPLNSNPGFQSDSFELDSFSHHCGSRNHCWSFAWTELDFQISRFELCRDHCMWLTIERIRI